MPQNSKISTHQNVFGSTRGREKEDHRDQEICFGHDGRAGGVWFVNVTEIEIGIVIIKKSRHGTSPQAVEICLLIKNWHISLFTSLILFIFSHFPFTDDFFLINNEKSVKCVATSKRVSNENLWFTKESHVALMTLHILFFSSRLFSEFPSTRSPVEFIFGMKISY